MLLRFKPFEVSSRFEFKDPDKGFTYYGDNLFSLHRAIIQYRLQNNLEPIEELNAVVENYLCSLPENQHKCQENKDIKRGMLEYVKAGVLLLKNVLFQQYETQAVAEKRAIQCVSCKHNSFPDKGLFMKWSDEVAISQVGERRVSVEKELGSCAVCTCVLKSKVFWKGKLPEFSNVQVEKMKEVNCWQLELSKQT